MDTRRTLLAAAFGLACVAASAGGTPPRSMAPAAPPQPSFAEAARLLRAGRHAAAYGHLVALADAGDRDAARVALVMHRFGKVLYGSEWDATNEQLADWGWLARLGEEADLAARTFRPLRRP